MTALPNFFRRGPFCLVLAMTAWVVLVGLPVFVGHRCGFGFGCLTSAAVFAAFGALFRIVLPVRS